MSKPQNFNLSALVQAHDTFTDVDGAVYEFRNQSDFGAIELARAERWQKQLPAISGSLQKNPGNAQAAERMEKISRDMFHAILPDVPEARLEELTLAQVSAVIRFWGELQQQKRNAATEAPGEAEADQES